MALQARNWKADVEAIRSVLMAEWDPIGCGVPEDEYDSYIPAIYRLMQACASIDDLAAYLQEVETKTMCLASRPDVNRRVSKLLLDLMK